MRPAELNPLFAPAETLSGIGPKTIQLLKKALRLPPGIAEPRIIDLLWHTPTGVIDRRATPTVAEAIPGTISTLEVRVLKHFPSPGGNSKAPYKVRCEDDSGRLDLIFFRADRRFVEKQLPVGEIRFVSGRIEHFNNQAQMTHPDYIVAPDKRDDLPDLEPVYPLTAGLTGKMVTKACRLALEKVPHLAEWQEPAWLATRASAPFHDAVRWLHRPQDAADISPGGLVWQRLAFDELLAGQLALGLVRLSNKQQKGRAITGDGRIRQRILGSLPFALTGAQTRALKTIEEDMSAQHRMLRLLQGDVGSGKTVVALMAMAMAVEEGAQAALMAPTEVLARQHIETMAPLAEKAGLRLGLLTGREKGRARALVLAAAAAGELDILIGTHALFQPDVHFKNLALAVIDEQHRFGVHQRMALQSKGEGTNVLVMTATPIPRTLQMTHYGDLEVSRLDEKPPGRKPVKTTMPALDRLHDIVDALKRALTGGAQIYWVCPLIESSEVIDLAAAEERAAHLKQFFGDKVGVMHGGMSGAQKDAVMAAFTANQLSILVSTTVIEVGVNVPNASVMVIEHAERFGLAQLHQLRGRVGRGDRQSYCMLLHKTPLGLTAEARLKMMCETEDGFLIAEKDLELRGAGEVLGARQSGLPEFRVATVPNFEELLGAARDDATMVLARDPTLSTPRGNALRALLYLFECDDAVRLFRSG
jgi:ATP-dependent DNA helicase RecG